MRERDSLFLLTLSLHTTTVGARIVHLVKRKRSEDRDDVLPRCGVGHHGVSLTDEPRNCEGEKVEWAGAGTRSLVRKVRACLSSRATATEFMACQCERNGTLPRKVIAACLHIPLCCLETFLCAHMLPNFSPSHIHTPTYSHTLSHSNSHTLFHFDTHTRTHAFFLSLSLAVSLCLSCCLSLSLLLSLSLSLCATTLFTYTAPLPPNW